MNVKAGKLKNDIFQGGMKGKKLCAALTSFFRNIIIITRKKEARLWE
jgi:hypothetical protein